MIIRDDLLYFVVTEYPLMLLISAIATTLPMQITIWAFAAPAIMMTSPCLTNNGRK